MNLNIISIADKKDVMAGLLSHIDARGHILVALQSTALWQLLTGECIFPTSMFQSEPPRIQISMQIFLSHKSQH